MNDLEKAALKSLAHNLVDDFLPKIIDAEAAKLPVQYAPLAMAIVSALKPSIVAFLDAKIDAL